LKWKYFSQWKNSDDQVSATIGGNQFAADKKNNKHELRIKVAAIEMELLQPMELL
jgi:hypothetical protein